MDKERSSTSARLSVESPERARPAALWRVLAGALAVVLGWAGAPLAHARTDAEIRDVVQTLIMNRHPDDTPGHWTRLGARAPAIIQQMYLANTSAYQRMRLLEGLGAFKDDAAATQFIKQRAESESNEVIRHAAMRSIGQNQVELQEEWLGGFLASDNAHTRLLAAELLRKSSSESARLRVERMMRDEKTDWVLAKLKGEVAPTPRLTPSGSTEDRLSPDFAGTWRGYWVGPRKVDASAPDGGARSARPVMVSEPVELSLTLGSETALSGELRVLRARGSVPSRRYRLSQAAGRGLNWSGGLEALVASQASERKPAVIAVEGGLARRSGQLQLEIRLTESGGILVLRRE